MIADRGALIQDRIRTIIAQSDPDKLGGGSEPGLETLRRQVKFQLDDVLGSGLIQEVLVPKCIPFRADF
jgi:flagellar basal body-associated protein FliL